MIDPKKIEQIARQVHESMPKGIREFGEDVEKKIRQTLQAQLTRLDLVSREEFDVQTQVLLRTREKLALLEQRISELENRSTEIKKQPDQPSHADMLNRKNHGSLSVCPARSSAAMAPSKLPAMRPRLLLMTPPTVGKLTTAAEVIAQ